MAFQRIQFRQDTAIRWQTVNPVLAMGEPAFETDTGKQKIGDGKTAYNALPYRAETGTQGPSGPVGPKGDAGSGGPAGPSGPQGLVGAAGPSNVLTIGTITGGPTAAATITGTSPSQTLNLVLPKGDTGSPGAPCALTIGAVTKGMSPSASISGVAPNQILNLILPQGDTGPQGLQGIQGIVGPTGPAGPQGPVGAGVIVQGSISTWPPATNPADGDLWLAGATLPVGTPAGTVQGDGFVYDKPTAKWINVGQIRGPAGPQGNTGLTGPQGPIGLSNTLSIGTVVGGTNAAASLTGASPYQVLNLVLPKGDQGIQGIQGVQGPIGLVGPTGPANSLTVGTVSQTAAGTNPAVTITGNAPAQTVSFSFPAPPINNLTIGTVTQGTTAAATLTGTAPNQVLNLVLPAPQIAQTTVFNLQPSSQSVFVGDTVTFRASADSTEAKIVYKWQSSPDGTTWTDIPNSSGLVGTTSVYSFVPVLADNGKRYRCVASTALLGNIFSLIVNLTVTVKPAGDGTVWAGTAGGVGTSNYGVTFANGIFVTGSGGWSDDAGTTWNSPVPSSTALGIKPTVGLGTVLSGQTGANGAWYTSSDGKNWVLRTRPAANAGNVVFGYGLGRFVAFWSAPPTSTIPNPVVQSAYSTDAINWTVGPAIPGLVLNQVTAIAAGNGNIPLLIATGLVNNGPTNQYLTSADGITWVTKTLASPMAIQDLTFGGTNFVGVGTGNQVIYTATPTSPQTTATLAVSIGSMPTSANWSGVTYGNSRFVAVASNSATAATSTNGSTWVQQTLPAYGLWSGVAYGLNKFIAVAPQNVAVSG